MDINNEISYLPSFLPFHHSTFSLILNDVVRVKFLPHKLMHFAKNTMLLMLETLLSTTGHIQQVILLSHLMVHLLKAILLV